MPITPPAEAMKFAEDFNPSIIEETLKFSEKQLNRIEVIRRSVKFALNTASCKMYSM